VVAPYDAQGPKYEQATVLNAGQKFTIEGVVETPKQKPQIINKSPYQNHSEQKLFYPIPYGSKNITPSPNPL
jgi:hypothetical protein